MYISLMGDSCSGPRWLKCEAQGWGGGSGCGKCFQMEREIFFIEPEWIQPGYPGYLIYHLESLLNHLFIYTDFIRPNTISTPASPQPRPPQSTLADALFPKLLWNLQSASYTSAPISSIVISGMWTMFPNLRISYLRTSFFSMSSTAWGISIKVQ